MTGLDGGAVVMLAGPGSSTNIVYNAVRVHLPLGRVILEQRVDRRSFLRARVRRLGPLRVAGQLLFQLAVLPVLRQQAGPRRRELLSTLGLDQTPIPERDVVRVRSANDRETIDILASLRPSVVIVNGTRILRREVLDACPTAVFLNIHAGITPRYRGVHGGYWALVSGDRDGCGVTVHLVDAGIDTGPIVAQAVVSPTSVDNFVTYPLLQLGAGIPLLIEAARAALERRLASRNPAGSSRLWTHPTVFEYLAHRIRHGIA